MNSGSWGLGTAVTQALWALTQSEMRHHCGHCLRCVLTVPDGEGPSSAHFMEETEAEEGRSLLSPAPHESAWLYFPAPSVPLGPSFPVHAHLFRASLPRGNVSSVTAWTVWCTAASSVPGTW